MTALDALLSPRAIAIVGASPDAGKIRGRIPAAILSGGYSGPIYPVNPAHTEIQGLRAYASIAAIGQPIDLAHRRFGGAFPRRRLQCGKRGAGFDGKTRRGR